MYRLNFYLVGLALLNSASVNAFLPSSMPNANSRMSNLVRFSTMDVEQERVEYVVRPNTQLPEDVAEVIDAQAQNYKNYFVMGDAEGLTEGEMEDGYQPMIPENHPFAWARLLGVTAVRLSFGDGTVVGVTRRCTRGTGRSLGGRP